MLEGPHLDHSSSGRKENATRAWRRSHSQIATLPSDKSHISVCWKMFRHILEMNGLRKERVLVELDSILKWREAAVKGNKKPIKATVLDYGGRRDRFPSCETR